jgi:hypothetical protein
VQRIPFLRFASNFTPFSFIPSQNTIIYNGEKCCFFRITFPGNCQKEQGRRWPQKLLL